MAEVFNSIKKGFGVAGKNLGLVMVLFLFNLVWNLASIPLAVAPGTTMTPQLTATTMIFSLLFILASIFVQGSILGIVRDVVKQGKAKLGSFLSYGLKYYLRLFGLGLLIIVIIAIVALAAALIIAATAPLNNVVITVIAVTIAIAIAVVATLFYFIPFALSPYALVSDELGVIASIKKALNLARKPFVRVFMLLLLFILLVLIALGIGFVMGFVVGMVSAVLPSLAGKILMAIATSILNGYLGIVMTGSFMVYYLFLDKGQAA